MIQTQIILRVADNSGAKTVRCIKIISRRAQKTGSKFAFVGDCIIVTVKSVRPGRAKAGPLRGAASPKYGIKKGQIFKALVIRTKKTLSSRRHGHQLSFQANDVVLINDQNNLLGSRIFGPITRELRAIDLGKKIISQSKRIL